MRHKRVQFVSLMRCYQTSTTTAFQPRELDISKGVALINEKKIQQLFSSETTDSQQYFSSFSPKEGHLIAKQEKTQNQAPAVLNDQSQSENCQ